MNEPITVPYDLTDILKELKQDIKDVNTKLEKLNTIEVKLATIETELKGMDKRLERVENTQDTLVKEVSDLKGFRSLILPLVVGGISAVIGGIVTAVFRLPSLLLKP
ncbi:MAG: shikimate dehydrogenase [Crocosphaera sp.]